jgi:cytokinin riboside 5'-monophosphate phosphoribohydrolase
MKNICIYCSSSNAIDSHYFDLANELGVALAKAGYNLVYGGSNVGLMHELATTMGKHGAHVTGVIPQLIFDKGLGYESIQELIITPDMSSRKNKMIELADAFITLPGGFGTLEEFFETLTLKQLQYHNKAIVLLNHNQFFDPLEKVFDQLFESKFAKPDYKTYFYTAGSVLETLTYLKSYLPPDFKDKWYWVGSDQFR